MNERIRELAKQAGYTKDIFVLDTGICQNVKSSPS